MAPDEGPH